MRTTTIGDYANSAIEKWMKNQITTGRSFPDHRDGLKEITRTIIQAMFSLAGASKKTQKLVPLLGRVSDYKDGSEKTNLDIFYRMTLSEYPIIDARNWVIGGRLNTINRFTGKGSKPRYIEVSFTPLGEYLMKYESYFNLDRDKTTDTSNPRWDAIRTPLPLSLLIPQINLADGISNSAPGLDLVELINAFIVHIEKDKDTTTADLAQHIKGPALSPDTTVLMTNQAIHDLIELGTMKFTQLVNIQIFKKDVLVKGLPFKTFGRTIYDNLTQLAEKGEKGDWSRGLVTFQMTQNLAENSQDSIVTFSFNLNHGYTIEDMRRELYLKTKLKSVIAYENIVNDFSQPDGKVLTIKSVRQTFDYHYDEAIELKTMEINSEIRELESKFGNAVFMEKVTKPIVAEIVASVVAKKDKRRLARDYLTRGQSIFRQYLTNEKSLSLDSVNTIAHVLPMFKDMLLDKVQELIDTNNSKFEEALDVILSEEIPSSWNESEIKLIFTDEYSVLYKLDKRDEALQIIENFRRDLEYLKSRLDLGNIKKEIIKELEWLKMNYEDQPKNSKLIALPFQEREKMREYRKRALKEMKTIPDDLPVNVLISEDGHARLSFSLTDTIPNMKHIFQVTALDNLVIVNRNADSRKIAVNSLTTIPEKILDYSDTLFVLPQDHNYLLEHRYILVTNKGRISCVSDQAFNFKNKGVRVGIAEDEYFVFAQRVPQYLFENGSVLVMKTSENSLKGISLFDLSMKNTLVEFYNLFNSPTTNLVQSVSILPWDTSTLVTWEDGWQSSYVSKIRCRNISKPISTSFASPDSEFPFSKVLTWGEGRPICDYFGATGEYGFETLVPPTSFENVSTLDEDIVFTSLSDFRLVNIQSTPSRLHKPTFEATNLQLEIISNKYERGV